MSLEIIELEVQCSCCGGFGVFAGRSIDECLNQKNKQDCCDKFESF